MSARTLGLEKSGLGGPTSRLKPPKGVDTRRCASKDARLRLSGLVGPTSIRKKKQVRARMLRAPKGDELLDPTSVGVNC